MKLYDGNGNEITIEQEETNSVKWDSTHVEKLDSLLSHIQYTDTEGGTIADELIESLGGTVNE